ncbi:Protein interacting with poly(A)-binding protein [Ceraceosorus bombacis]|uniref:Protein interacting with poly(A)-binding protein n=1 Tax=Ceraceosorus bombacis TaxID=401625 RepID=A0A0P1BHG0_9BASI|nr:Protein interacting with poly(A)-binding protein [Ceraceosorus bombacis]
MRERLTFLLVSLIGTPVVATTHGGFKFIGILSATSPDSDELGVALSAAQEVLPGGEYGPLRKMLVINGSDLDEVHASDVRLGEVQSEPNRKRDAPGGLSAASGALDGASRGGEWDQFKANEARFGLKSDYAEDLYTTRLDRSGKDFAQREREADRLAREIMGQASTNAHIAEERGQHENANITEEDRYVRSADRSEGTASVATSPKVAPRFAATASNVSASAASREAQPLSKGLAGMTIPKIPPFNPNGAAKRKSPALASSSTSATVSGGTASGAPGGASGLTASTSVFKMSAKANSFKPFNPNATAFTPGTTAKKDVSLSGVSTSAVPTNPFFGNRVIKKPTAPSSLHVREDFNPFKAGAASMPQPHPTGPGGPANNVAAPGTPGAQHVQPGQPAHPPQAGLPPHSQGGPPHHGQPFAPIMYAAQPYGAYRFQGQPQQQQMMPQMQMQPGAPMPYGAMPPHFAMQGMPFSPPLPPHGAPSGLYSPQMGHQMPHGPHGNQFMGGAGGHSGGPPPPPYVGGLPSGGPPPRPGHMPPHMQGKGPPGHFYQGQPIQGMTYGAPFPPGAQPFPPGGGPQASTGNGNRQQQLAGTTARVLSLPF